MGRYTGIGIGVIDWCTRSEVCLADLRGGDSHRQTEGLRISTSSMEKAAGPVLYNNSMVEWIQKLVPDPGKPSRWRGGFYSIDIEALWKDMDD